MWVELALNKPKTGQMVEFSQQGEDLFIANVAGQLFCAQNRCPHEDVKLTLGCLKGRRVKCSLHGFSFDLNNGNSDDPNVDKLVLYPVKERNNKIFVQL